MAVKGVSFTEAPTEGQEPKPPHGIRWGESILYVDGHAYGIGANGRTVYLGTEEDVERAIANPELKLKSPFPQVNEILEVERELIKKEKENNGRRPEPKAKLRTPKPNRPSNKRIRPLRNTRNIRNNARPVKAH